MKEYAEVCEEIREEQALIEQWDNYIGDNVYAAHLKYADLVDNVLEVGKYIEKPRYP